MVIGDRETMYIIIIETFTEVEVIQLLPCTIADSSISLAASYWSIATI